MNEGAPQFGTNNTLEVKVYEHISPAQEAEIRADWAKIKQHTSSFKNRVVGTLTGTRKMTLPIPMAGIMVYAKATDSVEDILKQVDRRLGYGNMREKILDIKQEAAHERVALLPGANLWEVASFARARLKDRSRDPRPILIPFNDHIYEMRANDTEASFAERYNLKPPSA